MRDIESENCLSLWLHALRLYLDDAMAYHKLTSTNKPIPKQQERYFCEAYRDITGRGKMLNYLCNKTGHEPEYLKMLFARLMKRRDK